MKKLILSIIIGFVSFTIYCQSESNTVMIKSIETYGSFASMKKNLYIINEDGELTSIELEKHNTNGIPENMLVIKQKLDEYLHKDYEIISSDAVSFGWQGVFTIEHTYILQKIKQTEN